MSSSSPQFKVGDIVEARGWPGIPAEVVAVFPAHDGQPEDRVLVQAPGGRQRNVRVGDPSQPNVTLLERAGA